MSIITKKNLVMAAKAVIVGIAATGLGLGAKALMTKKTGLPAGYEEGIVDDTEVSTEE